MKSLQVVITFILIALMSTSCLIRALRSDNPPQKELDQVSNIS